jgi:hypothetical protein
MTSTESGTCIGTYTQIPCCGAARQEWMPIPRYQRNSASKLLIYIETLTCYFFGHFKKTVDLQSFDPLSSKLSTKLSTENMDSFKVVINQRLSAFIGCVFEEVPISGYPK